MLYLWENGINATDIGNRDTETRDYCIDHTNAALAFIPHLGYPTAIFTCLRMFAARMNSRQEKEKRAQFSKAHNAAKLNSTGMVVTLTIYTSVYEGHRWGNYGNFYSYLYLTRRADVEFQELYEYVENHE